MSDPAGTPGSLRDGVLAVLAVVGVVAAAAALSVSRHDHHHGAHHHSTPDPTDEQATTDGWHGGLLTEAQPRPDFTLTDTAGRPYAFREKTAGRLTLLFFGYTSCPDVCPLHMATLSTALDQPDMPRPLVVFVTTDPGRDTPERLREWLDSFGTDFVGLTGAPDEILRAEEAVGLGTSFVVAPDGSPSPTAPAAPAGDDDYEVGHPAEIIAYTPDDLAHIAYPSGVQRDDWVADLPRLADGWDAG